MKLPAPFILGSARLLVALFLTAGCWGARAGTLYWDPTGTSTLGGVGTWDTSTTSAWSASPTGGAAGLWNQTGGLDIANIGGTAGNITLGGTVSANEVVVGVNGYQMIGTGTLNFTSTGTNIDLTPLSTNSLKFVNSTIISGSSGLTILGTGTGDSVTLGGGTNTYTGGTFVNSALLILAKAGSLGGGDVTVTAGTGVGELSLALASTSFGAGKTLNLATGSSSQSAFLNAQAASQTWAGNVVISGTGSGNVVFQESSASTTSLAVTGNITGSLGTGVLQLGGKAGNVDSIGGTVNIGTTNLQISTLGTWKISSAGNVWGITQLSAGTVQLGATDALDTAAALDFGSTSATLDLAGFDQTVAGFASVSAGTGVITNTGATAATITSSSGTTTYSGQIKDGTSTVGVKVTGGVLTLSGTDTYTGTTAVTGGTLLVNTTLSGSSSATVTNGTLGGTGTFSHGVTIGNGLGAASSAIIDPGLVGAIGTLATGALTFQSDGVYRLELNSTTQTADLLNVTGNLIIGAGAHILASDLGSSSLAPNTVFDILNYSGTESGTFAGLADGSDITVGANTFEIQYGTAVAGEITLTDVAAVPEAATSVYLLLGLAGAAWAGCGRRQRVGALAE